MTASIRFVPWTEIILSSDRPVSDLRPTAGRQADMPDAYTWQIRLRRRGELEPRLVETRQETRKPQLLETINLHLPDGPAVRAKIVHLTFISPSTYAVTANEV